ncbi:hypothetical protein C8R43DRAFT_1102398 [Mycena crocata]|nr:hypothetical protein C8R43DRAFT_1102398 [Mycena crocata]
MTCWLNRPTLGGEVIGGGFAHELGHHALLLQVAVLFCDWFKKSSNPPPRAIQRIKDFSPPRHRIMDFAMELLADWSTIVPSAYERHQSKACGHNPVISNLRAAAFMLYYFREGYIDVPDYDLFEQRIRIKYNTMELSGVSHWHAQGCREGGISRGPILKATEDLVWTAVRKISTGGDPLVALEHLFLDHKLLAAPSKSEASWFRYLTPVDAQLHAPALRCQNVTPVSTQPRTSRAKIPLFDTESSVGGRTGPDPLPTLDLSRLIIPSPSAHAVGMSAGVNLPSGIFKPPPLQPPYTLRHPDPRAEAPKIGKTLIHLDPSTIIIPRPSAESRASRAQPAQVHPPTRDPTPGFISNLVSPNRRLKEVTEELEQDAMDVDEVELNATPPAMDIDGIDPNAAPSVVEPNMTTAKIAIPLSPQMWDVQPQAGPSIIAPVITTQPVTTDTGKERYKPYVVPGHFANAKSMKAKGKQRVDNSPPNKSSVGRIKAATGGV